MAALTDHGGRVDLADGLYPRAPRPWLDLSTGINPDPWVPPAGLAVDLRTLPPPSALAGLEAAAATVFAVDPAHVAALPGSELGLRLLRDIGLPPPYRYVTPSYGSHAEAFPGATAIACPELDAAAALGGTILLANPNNPDGHVLRPERLIALAERLRARGGWLVIDEAFAEAVPQASIVPHLAPREGLIVLRSFGKFFGLAGVRLGFMVAPERMLAMLRARLGSWPLSATAIALGTAAYGDADWIATARTNIASRAAALDAMLAGHGLTARGACPLFRLVESDAAPALFERLAQAGILTRPFDHAPRWLRLGVPGATADLRRLDRALADG